MSASASGGPKPAIRDAASDGLTLAFAWGTALCRADSRLHRTSEDIGLRVIGDYAVIQDTSFASNSSSEMTLRASRTLQDR
jgi:hypothetical protein